MTTTVAEAMFGDCKSSGSGREYGAFSVEEYIEGSVR